MKPNRFVLILGANSDIAKALAKIMAQDGWNLYLASRRLEPLRRLASDLTIRYGITAHALYFDALDYQAHQSFYDGLEPKPEVVVLSFGYLGCQKEAQKDFDQARKIIEINFLGAVSILEIVARDFEKRQKGVIIGLSSVAGDRGRASNYIYGSSKAAFSAYLQGLRQRLYPSGVHVLTVKPGFVATKMTRDLDLPKPLVAAPEKVARKIYQAFKTHKDILYTPFYWHFIMGLIKAVPERVFKRLKM